MENNFLKQSSHVANARRMMEDLFHEAMVGKNLEIKDIL